MGKYSLRKKGEWKGRREQGIWEGERRGEQEGKDQGEVG